MNYSPQNEQGILGLIAALKGGADPTAAYGLFSNTQQQQAAQIAQRQQRMSSLAELLMGAATGGMPYEGAEALADAAPGPMGPAVQSMLSALYPTGEATPPGQPMSAAGQPIAPPPGYFDSVGGESPMAPGTANAGPQALSPTFQPPEPSVSDQLAMQEAAQQQTLMSDLTAMQADAAARKAEGWTLDQFVAAAQKNNPALFAMAPEQVKAILATTFGEMALQTMGTQPSVG